MNSPSDSSEPRNKKKIGDGSNQSQSDDCIEPGESTAAADKSEDQPPSGATRKSLESGITPNSISRPPTKPTEDDGEKTIDSVQDRTGADASRAARSAPVSDLSEATFQSESSPSHLSNLTDNTNVSDQIGRSKDTAYSREHTIASRGDLPGANDAAQRVDGPGRTGMSGEIVDFASTRAERRGPEKIGRYEIRRLLGEGAFGRVYEAHDPQLDRPVAIKVAKAISGATQVKRFLREARAAAQLRHPNIIPVYEYGTVDRENIIVYQFVDGETLKGFMRRQEKIPLSETVEIVRQIADALHYAHGQGIIHRDMKPDNVLIDAQGHPHVADFGCARSLGDETSLTIDGSILGTPMYMSPEQASGKSHSADGRSDIWSLGVMLFEMVGGDRPFGGSMNDLLYAICHEDAQPLRKLRPDTPLDIETICAKCLTRDLERRFDSGKTLAEELSRFQRGEPILSRPIGPLQRTWLWAKRNQAVASLLATVAITLVIGTIVSSWFAVQAYREQRARAFAQLDSLKNAEGSALPSIFAAIKPFKSTILPQLKHQLESVAVQPAEKHRLRMAILELEDDDSVRANLADQMVEDLLIADAGDFFVCRKCLEFRKEKLSEDLWQIALDERAAETAGRKFRAAAALALFAPTSEHWTTIAPDVAGYLTSLNQIEMSHWIPSLAAVRESLKSPLLATFRNHDDAFTTAPERAASILSRMFTDQPEFLTTLIPAADLRQLPLLTGALSINRAAATELLQTELHSLPGDAPVGETTNRIIALIQLNDGNQWEQLKIGADPTIATRLIEELGPALTPFEILLPLVMSWESTKPDLLAGVLLACGQFEPSQILASQKSRLRPVLLKIFSEASSARVHSSARWLLNQWSFDADRIAQEMKLRRALPESGKQWHVDLAGNTFAIFEPVDAFEMGLNRDLPCPPNYLAEFEKVLNEPRYAKRLPRRFGICTTEVTIGQYAGFELAMIARLEDQLIELKPPADLETNPEAAKLFAKRQTIFRTDIQNLQDELVKHRAQNPDLPVGNIDFYRAIAYCSWLSEREQMKSGLPTPERLFAFYHARSDLSFSMLDPNHFGYRLPTASEFEYALRGRTRSLFPFGQSSDFTSRYAWFVTNSSSLPHRVGELKPGNGGLFDQLGNVREWCLDWYQEKPPEIPPQLGRQVFVDWGAEYETHRSATRECRGGSYKDELIDLRSTTRFSAGPGFGQPYLGFRLTRTYE